MNMIMKRNYVYEEWKDIKGYEGLYQVSNFGRVKSLKRVIDRGKYGLQIKEERILKPKRKPAGYLIVNLCKNNNIKTFHIHRLVAEAFIPNPNNLPQVNHKGEIKDKNFVWQLEWCTVKYNNNYGTKIERRIKTGIKNGTIIPEEERKEYYKTKAKEKYEKIKNSPKLREEYLEYRKNYMRKYRKSFSQSKIEEIKKKKREWYYNKKKKVA